MKSPFSLSPRSLQCTVEFAQDPGVPMQQHALATPSLWHHPLVLWKSYFSFVIYLHIQDNVSAFIFPNSLQAELCVEMSHTVSSQPCVS